jgi:glycosyltransferase involved in cell wall biosynthesis
MKLSFTGSPVHRFAGSPVPRLTRRVTGFPYTLLRVTRLTVTVITHNEGPHIAAALESVAWADEIVIVDSGSTDDTVLKARRFATRIEVREWDGYGTQKNYAAGLASNDWILSIDADERVAPALAGEIRELMARGPDAAGYEISRVAHYLGRWIRSTDWYPDYHVRLYDRRAARWSEHQVHESIQCPGRVKRLRGELLHYPYRDVSEHLIKIDRYTTLVARQWAADGRRSSAWRAIVYPRLAFLRNFVLRRGFRDGRTGLMVSMLNSYYVFLKYVKLFEMQQQAAGSVPASDTRAPKPAPGAGP